MDGLVRVQLVPTGRPACSPGGGAFSAAEGVVGTVDQGG
jgi:hypothetical protein